MSTSSDAASCQPAGTAALEGPRTGPLRNGNPRGNPNLAPRCGARARTTGCACRAPAMANGRCRMHGGACTGPRTPEGMARMIAANTTHGHYAAEGALERIFVKTLVGRFRLACAASNLRAYLPPVMQMRLAHDPEELKAPKHHSQVAFEAFQAANPCTVSGRAMGPVAGVAGRVADRAARRAPGRRLAGLGLAVRARSVERAAVAREAALRAPWKAAIAYARALKRAVRAGAKGTARDGAAGGIAPVARDSGSYAIHREMALRAAGLRGALPASGAPRGGQAMARIGGAGMAEAGEPGLAAQSVDCVQLSHTP